MFLKGNAESLQRWLKDDVKLVALTGAGVSTSSGIPDFKSLENNWPYRLSRADMMTPVYFKDHPKEFWEMFRNIFPPLDENCVKPTAFHKALAKLEERISNLTVFTQNVDSLHQRAGNSAVYELHGELRNLISPVSFELYPYGEKAFSADGLPYGPLGEILRPNVRLFMEGIDNFEEARDHSMRADVFLVAGTSLNVGPVNELPLYVRYYSKKFTKTIYVNDEEPSSDYEGCFNIIFKGTTDEFSQYLQ